MLHLSCCNTWIAEPILWCKWIQVDCKLCEEARVSSTTCMCASGWFLLFTLKCTVFFFNLKVHPENLYFAKVFYIIIYLFRVIQYFTNKTFCSAIINKNTPGHIYIYWGHKWSLYLNVVRNWVIISSYKGLVPAAIFHEMNCYFSVTWQSVARLRFKSALPQIYPCLKKKITDM